MNKEKLLDKFKENLVTVEFQDKEKVIETTINKYTEIEKKQIENWKDTFSGLSYLIKQNANYATIIYLSGFKFFKEIEKNVIYTTSVVVNRNYLNNALNHSSDLKNYFGNIYRDEKVIIIKIQRNRRRGCEWYKLNKDIHLYGVLLYKEFFNKDTFNILSLRKEQGYKILLIVEGIGLPLLKIIFKTFGIVISSGKNSFKGTLSPTQFNLSRFMFSVLNTSAY